MKFYLFHLKVALIHLATRPLWLLAKIKSVFVKDINDGFIVVNWQYRFILSRAACSTEKGIFINRIYDAVGMPEENRAVDDIREQVLCDRVAFNRYYALLQGNEYARGILMLMYQHNELTQPQFDYYTNPKSAFIIDFNKSMDELGMKHVHVWSKYE